jgi:hypothetical protein
MTLEQDYTLDEVAAAVRMSTRWVRDQISAGAEHTRRGNKIRFTAQQVEALRARHAQQPVTSKRITTGRRRAS